MAELKKITHDGKTYVLRSVSCGKENCRRCPHGPYWYRAITTRRGVTFKYHGKRDPRAGQVDLVDVMNTPQNVETSAKRFKRVCPECGGLVGSDGYKLSCAVCEWQGHPSKAALVEVQNARSGE